MRFASCARGGQCDDASEDAVGASILLLEDGVYAAMRQSSMAQELSAALQRVVLYALEPDLMARGISPERRLPGIATVDYSGFVELAVSHEQVIAWR